MQNHHAMFIDTFQTYWSIVLQYVRPALKLVMQASNVQGA
jgi:hypothetical protein